MVVLEEYEHAKSARRQDLCRAGRLRHVGRRLSHHRAGRGRRWRAALHEGGACSARRHFSRRTSTTSTRTAPRRRSATRSSLARCRTLVGNAAGRRSSMSSTKSVNRPPARRGRRGRSDLLRPARFVIRLRRRRSISTILRSTRRSTWSPHQARKRDVDIGAVEFVRISAGQTLR